jgi:hypothetical protein
LLSCAAVVRTVFDTDAEEEIKTITLSDVKINIRITDMSVNSEQGVSQRIN